MKILFYDDNEFYKHGLQLYLNEVVSKEYDLDLDITTMRPEDVSGVNQDVAHAFADADIIFNATDIYSPLYPRLIVKKLKAQPLLINIAKNRRTTRTRPILDCVKNTISIDRKIKFNTIGSLIASAPLISSRSMCNKEHQNCKKCFSERLSAPQKFIASSLHLGHSIQKISAAMNIKYGSVNAHKRAIMHNFDLRTNRELSLFLKYYYEMTAAE